MPGRKTTTGTFPIKVVLEKERFGGKDLGAVARGFGGLDVTEAEGVANGLGADEFELSSLASVS